jgi:hypothetical protein
MSEAKYISVTQRVGETEAEARAAAPTSVFEYASPGRLTMRQLRNDRMIVSDVYWDDKHYFAKPPDYDVFTVGPALTVEAQLQILAEVTNWGQGNAVTSDGLTRVFDGDTYRLSIENGAAREVVVETADPGDEHIRVSTYTYGPVTVEHPSIASTTSRSCDQATATGSFCFENGGGK